MSTAASQDPAFRARQAREQAREAETLTVGPLLARANLLRMRGQWDEAVAVCTEALRHVPDSPTAHALIGDVYAAQNRVSEAITWYTMAVDLDNNPSDRAKLAALVEKQARAEAQMQPATPSVPKEKTAEKKEKTVERTMDWVDRTFPPGKSESIARLLFIVSGVIAVLLMAGFAYVYFVLPKGDKNAPTLIPPQNTSLPTVLAPPSATKRSAPVSQSTPTPALPKSAIAPVPATPASEATPAETALREGLGRAANGLFTVASVRVTPDNSQASLEIVLGNPLPSVSSGPLEEAVRESVLRAAAQVARQAVLVNGSLKSVAVRVLTPGGVSAAQGGTPTTTPVFYGEIEPSALNGLEPMTTPGQTLLSRFRTVQWLGSTPAPNTSSTTGGTPSPVSSPANVAHGTATSSPSGATPPATGDNTGVSTGNSGVPLPGVGAGTTAITP
jgi:hypothetical protein